MLAGFSVVPVGYGEGISNLIAELVLIIEDSGLPYVLGPMQTTIEGEPEQVLDLIMKCHRHARKSSARVLTHITIDDRQGSTGRIEGKIKDVEEVLGRNLPNEHG